MAVPVRITEADLKSAMAEPRYRGNGQPERDAYYAWVSQGWRALNPPDGAARGAVWVRPYRREGKPVAGHWRSPPPGGTGSEERRSGSATETPDRVELAQWRLPPFLRPPVRGPADRGGGGGGNRGERRNTRPALPIPADPGDEVGRRIDRLWQDSLTQTDTDKPILGDNAHQWRRDGGPGLREADLARLGPSQFVREYENGARLYRLDATRQVIVRVGTTRGVPEWPTLQIQRVTLIPGDRPLVQTLHKFRYRLTD